MLFSTLASRSLVDVIRPGCLLGFALGSLVVLLGGLFGRWKAQRKPLTESACRA